MELRWEDVDAYKVLRYAERMKKVAAGLAREYMAGRYELLVTYCARVWGGVPSTVYDYIPPHDRAVRSLLAALIAERTILRSKGIVKNLSMALVGTAGAGKTSYAVNALYGAYRMLGMRRNEAWEATAASIFFDIGDFIAKLRDVIESRGWMPCMIIDDIGASLTKYWLWLREERKYVKLFTVLDQVKDWTGVLIVTARAFSSIPSRFREIVDIVVEVSEHTIYRYVVSVARYYKRASYDSTRRRPIFVESFPPTLRMPDWMWRQMTEARASRSLAKIRELLEEKDEGEEGGYG